MLNSMPQRFLKRHTFAWVSLTRSRRASQGIAERAEGDHLWALRATGVFVIVSHFYVLCTFKMARSDFCLHCPVLFCTVLYCSSSSSSRRPHHFWEASVQPVLYDSLQGQRLVLCAVSDVAVTPLSFFVMLILPWFP